MNDRDSELVAGLLIKKGYKLADSIEGADIILFNTCSVRQRAEDKVWSAIGKLKKLRTTDHRPQTTVKSKKKESINYRPLTIDHRPIIGLIGCMAQEWQQAVFNKTPLVDLVVGPNNISAIPGLLDDMQTSNAKGLAVGADQRDAKVYNTEYIGEISHCNVNIMEGCNNFCSYCIVPYVRGRESSRPAEDIIKEIKALVKKGVKEITLLGQNVNSYNSASVITNDKLQMTNKKQKDVGGGLASSRNKKTFTDLLKMVNDIKGIERFDFVTSNPKDANTKLFKTMAELTKCKRFLHLPAQSGSDRILKKMGRGYTRSKYLGLIKKARQIMPDLRMTTDIMVGFPGETKKDFEDTFDLMKQVQFSAAYIFKYSPRPFTKAAKMEDDVSQNEKKRRNQILLEYQRSLHKKRKQL